MKNTIFLFLIAALLSACTSTKKFTRIIEPKLIELAADSVPQNAAIIISGNDTSHKPVRCIRERQLLVPAILYWQWNNTMRFDMNKQTITSIFKTHFVRNADSMGLTDRLNGAQLELSIDSVPYSFRFTNKGFTLFYVVGYLYRILETISPVNTNLVFHYRLVQNGVVTKKGRITIQNKDTLIKNVLLSKKRLTRLYLDQFNSNMNQLSKQAVQEVLNVM
ncbi:MAG: hypothetical protein WC150_03260 [Bacteroidia bacterium]